MSSSGAPANAAYRPGTCNIGHEEIRRRRRFGHAAAVATAGMIGVLLATEAPRASRVVVALPAAGAASGYLQAHARFCAGFGQQGVFNFGRLGDTTPVADADALEADRRRSREISLRSLAIGLGVAAVAILIPGR
jgi:hypothetical protein